MNRIMELTDEQKQIIKASLEQLKAEFEPTEDEPVLLTHGLVARYNATNQDKINGDTAEHILEEVV